MNSRISAYVLVQTMKTNKIEERFNRGAKGYDSRRKYFVPFMNEFYSAGIKLIAGERQFKSIIDLGAGTGLLAEMLSREFPGASFTLVDVSADMLDAARKRFAGMVNFRFVNEDYTLRLPEGKYDLAASALSIHHLPDNEKARLYKRVYDSLNKGGWFLNIDQYNSENRLVNCLFTGAWNRYMDKMGLPKNELRRLKLRRRLDRETTMQKELDGLKKAGFRECGRAFQYLKFGVIVARK